MKLKDVSLILLLAVIILGTAVRLLSSEIKAEISQRTTAVSPKTSPVPTVKKDEPFRRYTPPAIQNKRVYTIVMLGDSMTHALGPHGGEFSERINELYKPIDHEVIVDNYASGSTSILSFKDITTKETKTYDVTFAPLLKREFDVILVESFGYNPLSQFGLEGGLKKQNEALDDLMKTLIEKRPNALVFTLTGIIGLIITLYAMRSSAYKLLSERYLK